MIIPKLRNRDNSQTRYFRYRNSIGANLIVVSGYHFANVKSGFKYVIYKLFCGKGSKGSGERNYFHPVHTHSREKFLFLLQCGEEPEAAGVLLEDGAGMGPECNDKGLPALFSGAGDQCLDYTAVSKVDAVEKACCRYNHFTHSKS